MVSISSNYNSFFNPFKEVVAEATSPVQEVKKKPNIKKAIAVASAAAASVGIAMIAINKIKKGQSLKEVQKATSPLQKYFDKTKLQHQAKVALDPMKKQISSVARRTKPSYVAKRTDDLAKAFGAVAEHVPQLTSIVG